MNRIPFADMKDFIELPDLKGHQIKSYKEFLEHGIGEVLEQVFPIKDKEVDGVYEFQQLGYYIELPTLTPKQVKKKNGTYNAKLKVRTRLINKTFGDIKESDVFFCEIPYMTENGKFIVNGVDRVVVTQITKAPGAFYNSEISDKGKTLYSAKIQPDRGTYISYETDNKGIANVRIDQNHKMLLTVFLKALGLGNNEDIIELFGPNKYILAALEKDKTETYEEALIEFFRKARPNEVPTVERAKNFIQNSFFDPKRYNLEKTGRFKLNEKLSLANRTLKKPLAEPVGDFGIGYLVDDEVLSVVTDNILFIENRAGEKVKVIGNKETDSRCLTLEDIVASVSYFLNIDSGVGTVDDIDHLSNRTIKLVGRSLQKEFLNGLRRAERYMREQLLLNASNNKKELDELTPQKLIHTKQIESKFREFLAGSQLSQYIDQINPLGELSNIRRTSAIGPGGFSRERAGVEVRDVNSTHYGRLCPIETPEGSNVGLINQLSTFAHINEYGFITSPYRKVDKKEVKATSEIKYLTADIEEKYYIAEASTVNEDGSFITDLISVRYGKEYLTVHKNEVDYVAVSSKQPFGIGSVCIPFLENDDANRALMGANMQRQGVPTIKAEAPLVATGIEARIAQDTMASLIANQDGTVYSIDDDNITIMDNKGKTHTYTLNKFMRTNDGTCWNHYVKCHIGQKVKKGDILADSTTSDGGELAVGQNLLVAFMPMEGYNYEDSIVLSERLVHEDVLSVIMLHEYKTEVRGTKLGPEEITWEIPQTSDSHKKHLDDEGIVKIGTYVEDGDILVGKRTPKAKDEKKAQERLLEAMFIGRTDEFRDNSLRMGKNKKGFVIDIIRNTMKDSDLKKGVIEEVKVTVAEIRKVTVGDKMAGRHGNKGVISSIRAIEDMPHLEDGTPVDIVLNPLGVPSRMNIGQVMELHLGMVARTLGVKFETPVFGGIDSKAEIQRLLVDNGLPADGKFMLTDGRTGEQFDNPVSVGVMYMAKLIHQVDDKVHSRSTGGYSLVTQQPLGGKAQNGGQRFGEMEVWALEGYGAAYTLQELMTIKSDDYIGRQKLYRNLIQGSELPKPNLTESLKLLISEIKAIGLDIDIATFDDEMLLQPKYKPERIVLPTDDDYLELDFISEMLNEDALDDIESLDKVVEDVISKVEE